MIELQNFERDLDRWSPQGTDIADAYMKHMLDHCQRYLGKIFVAEIAGRVVGYVSIWARVEHDEPNASPREHGLISDLVVLTQYRGKGIGRKLLARAELYARDCNVQLLRICVLATNETARSMYESLGFKEYEIQFEKELGRQSNLNGGGQGA